MEIIFQPPQNVKCDVRNSLGKDSLTLFVGNHWATGWLQPYDLIWPRVKGGIISNPLFAYTGLKCKLWQSVAKVIKTGLLLWVSIWRSQYTYDFHDIVFNRPGVAGAVLQTPSSFIEWSFSSKSSKQFLSQTVRARELTFWENVYHMSRGIMFFDRVIELVGGRSVINGTCPI